MKKTQSQLKLLLATLLCAFFRMAWAQAPQKITIYFPFNKYYITNDAALTLEKAIKASAGKTIDSIKIYTFCDSIGALMANDTLAGKRAASVKSYFLSKKTGSYKFKEIKGFGSRILSHDNSTDSLRALNRRAEILIFARSVTAKDSAGRLLQNLQAGEKMRLSNIQFYGSRHILIPSSLPVLESLVKVLQLSPSMEIEIQGYVCCVAVGKEGYDRDLKKTELSSSRARAIYDYLLSKGIGANRLSYKGFGNIPLVAEITEEDQATNRRVEIKILKK